MTLTPGGGRPLTRQLTRSWSPSKTSRSALEVWLNRGASAWSSGSLLLRLLIDRGNKRGLQKRTNQMITIQKSVTFKAIILEHILISLYVPDRSSFEVSIFIDFESANFLGLFCC